MNGTRDYTAFLTIPACIEFMDKYNWTDVAKQSANLTRENGPKFCDLAGSKPLAPLNDEFYGQLFSIPIKTDEPQLLQKILFDKYHIEIPVMLQNHKIYLRYSINGFNTQQDLDNLENAVKELILAKTIIT
jgi:isopenicillin-N epimerase